MTEDLQFYLKLADVCRRRTITALEHLRRGYLTSDAPPAVKKARVTSIDAKIMALQNIATNPEAHPWSNDDLSTTTPAAAMRGHDHALT